MHEVVAEVWRNELAESVHHGSVVGLARDGSIAFTVGQPAQLTYPRSSLKPIQGVAMLRGGLALEGELLALACASHPGQDFHIDGVRRILSDAGLSPADLQCTPALPTDELARATLLTAGAAPAPLYMNCSGKHAGMLATCVAHGWPTATYRDPGHPLQIQIRHAIEELSGERVGRVGVDGCGAPLFGISLVGLAVAFRALATAPEGTEQHRIATAMHAHPDWVGGSESDLVTVVRALPGSVAKDGAEGVHAIGLPDGRAVAMKIADGSTRARYVVLVAALRRLGVTTPELDRLAEAPVLGHGQPVGSVRPSGALVTGRSVPASGS